MWLRFCFKCSIIKEFPEQNLDKNILRKLWLSKSNIIGSNIRLRSSMVLRCINDYENEKKYPKSIINDMLER